MGMESPDNCREADDSYRARSVGRRYNLPSAPAEGADEQTPRLSGNRALDHWLHLAIGDIRLPGGRLSE